MEYTKGGQRIPFTYDSMNISLPNSPEIIRTQSSDPKAQNPITRRCKPKGK